jgi:hypothetical protein
VAGNPFRTPPVVDPSWMAWSGGLVYGMLRVVDRGQRFGELPILADALEEAGCRDDALLAHLRQPAGHARGCWALDVLLGRS